MSMASRLQDQLNNPLQNALDNYHEMERERDEAVNRSDSLAATNSALVAEVTMLREELTRADADRLRLSAISSTLLGRLMAIHDTIAGAVKAAGQAGVEATAKIEAPEEPAERQPQKPAEAVSAAPEIAPPETPIEWMTPPAPPQALGKVIPQIDWSRPPQG